MKNTSSYTQVTNRPIGCSFCDAQIQGRVTPKKDGTGRVYNECRWVCPRCSNLVKVGVVK